MDGLEELLGYKFSDINLLKRALTHPSYTHVHGGENYQVMEFLGDKIVDFVIADELCRHYPDRDEGSLTKMRSAIVSKQPLAEIVEQRGYDRFIKLGFGELESKMRSDIFEALSCAIYRDGGMEQAKAFILRDLAQLIDNASANSQNDYKSALYEKYCNHDVNFECKDKSGPEHCPIFTVELYVDGILVETQKGKSKKQAEQKCAEMFLKADKK